MKKYFFILLAFAFPLAGYMTTGIGENDIRNAPEIPGQILLSKPSVAGLLAIIQGILLKAVLPILIVGTALYVAYQLFTADGDESRMKQAWKSVTYSAIALVIIALSYALISLFSSLSL